MRRIALLLLPLLTVSVAAQEPAKVILRRTPDRGIQPQAVMHDGTLHLIYFKGEPGAGDVFYVKSTDDGETYSKPLRVNSQPNGVIATGNIRGAQLAVGAKGRPHVAWMGAAKAEPRAPGDAMPMLYTRLNDDGTAFEPQRNLITKAPGLDGGGTIAADGTNVDVMWHAPEPGKKGEANRRVWMATSIDEGKSFAPEKAISPAHTGCCGCCGMRAAVVAKRPVALYRSASEPTQRDVYLLRQDVKTPTFNAIKLGPWKVDHCPMSMMAFAESGKQLLAAWDTDGQVYWTRLAPGAGAADPIAAPGKAVRRRFPVLAGNGREVLFAWTEGMGWNQGGAVAWQVYDVSQGKCVPLTGGDATGRRDGVPTWSLLSAVKTAKGDRFLLYY